MTRDLSPGSRAPSFRLSTDDGGHVSTAGLKGRPFVLYFYPKDDTSGCTGEALAFSQRKTDFDALGITVVGISRDTVASHRKFRDKYGLALVLASDPDAAVAKAWGVWVEKSMYGRRYMGLERATFLIDATGKIRVIWRKVKVPGHAEAVLDAAQIL